MSANPLDDPVFSKYKFYAANPNTKLNKRRLIRSNSIYDDGTDSAVKKLSRTRQSFIELLDNITLHCYNHLVEPNRSIIEKYRIESLLIDNRDYNTNFLLLQNFLGYRTFFECRVLWFYCP